MDLKLRSLKLQRRSFRGQNLRGIDFSGVDLSGVDFTDAILDGANFSHADLRGTVFRRTSLIGADLQFTRSGIPNHQELILWSILLLLAILFGIFAGYVGSSTVGLLTNESKIFIPYREIKFLCSWNTVAGLVAIGYGIICALMVLLKNPATAIFLGISSIIIIDIIVVGNIINACNQAGQPWEVVGNMVFAIGGSAIMIIFQAIFTTVCLSIVINILQSDLQIFLAVAIGTSIALTTVVNTIASSYAQIATITTPLLIIYISFKIGGYQNSKEQNYDPINIIATYIATYFGTCFHRANLTDGNLSHAVLSNTNLTAANLTHTNLYGVQQLNSARIDRTMLVDPLVRDLLVTHQGNDCVYLGCDLQGAYLANANLRSVDLTSANLSNANLSGAQLDHANLTRVLATDTNFQTANFTGTCIADWSIDRTTQLADIICNYIYLQAPGVERIPASGSFKTGDFMRLFQEIWNTVDLIFHQGVDWLALGTTWQKIQIENAEIPLAIHSIERKGEGIIVVKVEVPLDTDKARLHQEFDRSYNLLLQSVTDRYQIELDGRDRELAIYKEQQTQLHNILQSLVTPSSIKSTSEQLVTIRLGTRDLDRNLAATVEIGDRGKLPRAATVGILNCEDLVIIAYQNWQIAYRQYLNLDTRIDIQPDQTTNLTEFDPSIGLATSSDSKSMIACQLAAQNLKQQLNIWLDQAKFRPIKELMLQELHPAQSIQIDIQTDELQIRQLPFQLWNFCDQFTHAEIAISSNTYRAISPEQTYLPIELQQSPPELAVLAVFGSSEGLDLQLDRDALAALPNAKIESITEPTRQVLTAKLWEKPWDLLFFAGHSNSDPSLATGYLKINPTDRLTITELKYALRTSIESGLKLVIINSCDGLGIAAELISMQLSCLTSKSDVI